MAGKITAVPSTSCECFTHLGKVGFDFDSWNETEKKEWIKQLLLQACEEAEMQSINNQITWAITHEGSVLEKRDFWMVFCNVFRWEQKERGRADK